MSREGRVRDRAWNSGLLFLRLTGLYLAFGHGHMKFASLMHGEADRFIGAVTAMGFPQPVFFAWMAASAEFVGGLFVFLGFLTRVAAAFAAIDLFTAAFAAHHAHVQALNAIGVSSTPAETLKTWGNPELAIVYGLAMLCLVLCGPGRFSIDGMIHRRMGRD
jgi:putative oxidoreductase